MSWRAAFLAQARSEERVRQLLNATDVEYSHRLHYLQMVTEKLAKGLMSSADHASPPTHRVFVRCLQTLKRRPEIRQQLGFKDAASFRNYIDSLLDVADLVERLAPAVAGQGQPNAEYPWLDKASNRVEVPAAFRFGLYDPRTGKMERLEELLTRLVRIAR